jgi:hypothetical protein
MTDYAGIAQVITAAGIAIGAIFAIWAKFSLDKLALQVRIVKDDIRKVELATNSMKDALVKAAGDEGRATGEAKGRADQKAETHQQTQDDKLEAYQLNDQTSDEATK